MKFGKICAMAGALALTASVFGAATQITLVKEPTKEAAVAKENQPASPLDFTVKDIAGNDARLSQYKGKVVMIVNVASRCGFTPQYDGLEALYKKYADQGFVILGFPANDFGAQEPGTNEEIATFCKSKHNVTFPMMAKIATLGAEKAPIYKFLTEQPSAGDFAGDIAWNFNKFIVDRNGNVIARYGSPVKPDDKRITAEVEKALAAKAAEKVSEKK